MADLALKTKKMGFKLEQVQDFTPTPMTVATVIYYSGFHPYTLQPVYTPVTKEQKLEQRNFFFWYKKEYKTLIKRALKKAGHEELALKLLSDTASARSKLSSEKFSGAKRKKHRKTGKKGEKRSRYRK